MKRRSEHSKAINPKRRFFKRTLQFLLVVFVLMNIVAAFHAYKFTHFNPSIKTKTKSPGSLSAGEKIAAVLFGVDNPRPRNYREPKGNFETISLNSVKKTECWLIKQKNAIGTVAIFHGYSGNKASMLDQAEIFQSLGYNTFVVDFMGCGGSEGNQTTIGFYEAEQVKSCYDYLKQNGEKNIYLFGTSMGAVAIMKAVHDNQLKPKAIILECPFGSLYETVTMRFNSMKIPSFPMANLVVFWGGVENGFWAFGHNPTKYAAKINCPTLLLYGAKDRKVSRTEINEIYKNLKGKKQLNVYLKAGHESYLNDYRNQWKKDVKAFLIKN